MCLIAYREAGGPPIPALVVQKNLTANPDGFGIMWRDANGVSHIKFAPSEADKFTEWLGKVDAAGVEYGAHWRKATHGHKDREMAHPYPYTDASGTPIVAMHNGIIDIQTEKQESDTYRFVHSVLAKMETGWWKQNHLRFLVEGAIGWSRFLLMTPDETVLLNEKEWVSEDGIDYSCRPIWKPTTNSWQGIGFTKNDPPVTVKKVDGPDPLLLPVPSVGNVGSNGSNDDAAISAFGEPPSDWEIEQFGPFWENSGHYVMKLGNIDDDGDDNDVGECACWDCGEEGDYYVIDGETYFDIKHVVDDEPSTTDAREPALIVGP